VTSESRGWLTIWGQCWYMADVLCLVLDPFFQDTYTTRLPPPLSSQPSMDEISFSHEPAGRTDVTVEDIWARCWVFVGVEASLRADSPETLRPASSKSWTNLSRPPSVSKYCRKRTQFL